MQLRWDVHTQFGFLDINPRTYDEAYFNKYQKYAETEMGKHLNDNRLEFVKRNYKGALIDIGVGSLQFVLSRDETFGYDVNETAVKKLQDLRIYADPSDFKFPAWVFMSIPIFKDVNHILHSKHFRPDEHFWYFTTQGLIRYMLDYGFICRDIDNFETRIGREDILSFAFKKDDSK